jgi:hypothetical protein
MTNGLGTTNIVFTLPASWAGYRNKMRQATSRPADDVLAAAFAAFRLNKGYEKNHVYENYVTPDGDHITTIKRKSNKTMVYEHLMTKELMPITNEDKDNVVKAREHFKKYTLHSLGSESNGLNEFESNVYACMIAETHTDTEFGIVAYIPALMERELREKELKKTIKADYSNSNHQGAVGEKLTTRLTILNKRYLQSYQRYVYNAGDGENLFSFWHISGSFDVNGEYDIEGKVKSHGTAYKRNEDETVLNYVKFRRT